MTSGEERQPERATEMSSLVDSVIRAGKAAVKGLGAEDIRRFIANQPGVKEVTIESTRGSGAVGASSGIILFKATYDAGQGRVTQDLVLRHAPGSDTRLFFEYDLTRQFTVQRALQGSGAPVPKPLWLDATGQWLGVAGYIMEFRPGSAPHPSAFLRGPIAEAPPEVRAEMIREIMRALVIIHGTDIQASGLEHFAMNAEGDSPLRRSINWYWKTWEWIHQPQYERLIPIRDRLLAEAPDGKPELIHGDSTLHNYMFYENRLVGIVDWEMSGLGRAEEDLAMQCWTNHLFAAPRDSGVTQPPSDDEWIALYREAGGRPLEHFAYFKKLVAYKIVASVSSLQRNLSPEAKLAQEPLLRPCWQLLES